MCKRFPMEVKINWNLVKLFISCIPNSTIKREKQENPEE